MKNADMHQVVCERCDLNLRIAAVNDNLLVGIQHKLGIADGFPSRTNDCNCHTQ
jgi:hypothetical protein